MIAKNTIFVLIYIIGLVASIFVAYKLIAFISKKLAIKYLKKDLVEKIKLSKLNNMNNLKWKILIKEFIKYIETFYSYNQYTNLKEILELTWLENNDIQDIMNIIYKDNEVSENIENKIKSKINLLIKKSKW